LLTYDEACYYYVRLVLEMTTEKKTALVTGGNRGLGFETCRQLAQLGVSVILSTRDITKGEIAAKQLIDRGLDVVFYHLDVSDHSHVDRIAYQVEQQFGRIDVLVNNAAILYDTWQSAVDADFDNVNQAITTILFGPWKLSQICIRIMKRNKYGSIVNVSRGAGWIAISTETAGSFTCVFVAGDPFTCCRTIRFKMRK
jgi:NAD(P)-dependent dehydrogenase (short-subunit alcohol dehydrogenase family)